MRLLLLVFIAAEVRRARGSDETSRSGGSQALDTSDSSLPHCKKTTAVTGEISHESLDDAQLSVATTVQLQLALRETACFNVLVADAKTSSSPSSTANATSPAPGSQPKEELMYSLQYAALEDHHPIRGRYEFGVPQLTSHCKCDCPGGVDHCPSGFGQKNCSRGAVCFTTYHAHRAAQGCPSSGDGADVCCQVAIRPYQDKRYWALRLGAADSTVASFVLKLFAKPPGGVMSLRSANRIYIPLSSQQAFTLGRDKLRLKLHGPGTSKHLDPGTYFVRDGERSLRAGVKLNDIQEWNFGKLGWFRRSKAGAWTVRNGWPELQARHHVVVKDCKKQQYRDTYRAFQYVSNSEVKREGGEYRNHALGSSVEELESWLERAEVRSGAESRFAVAAHGSAPALTLDLTMDNRPRIQFFHHRSELKDFSGSIRLDKFSNRYLNVSLEGAKGTLKGNIYRRMDKEHIDVAFSTYVHGLRPRRHRVLIGLPGSVNGSRWVCFRPNEGSEPEKCKWFRFHATPLPWFVIPDKWTVDQGTCEGCNSFSLSNVLSFLNPRKWLDGISSTSEAVAVGIEVAFYLVLALVLIAILRKCVCPFVSWTLKSSKKKTPV